MCHDIDHFAEAISLSGLRVSELVDAYHLRVEIRSVEHLICGDQWDFFALRGLKFGVRCLFLTLMVIHTLSELKERGMRRQE